MRHFSRFFLRLLSCLVLLLSITGCDFYLPQCGSASILKSVRDQTISASGLERLEDLGMVIEMKSSLKDRSRSCQVTVQPTREFVDRLNKAKSQEASPRQGGLLGILGKALVTEALPDRLGSTTIQFQIQRDARSAGFGVQIEDESLDQLSQLDTAYKLTDLAIRHLLAEGDLPAPGSDH